MPLKRKSQFLSAEANSKKKPYVSKTTNESRLKNITEEKKTTSKKNMNNELKEVTVTKIKMEETSPKLVEENTIVKPTGSVNLILNQLVQKRSKFNMQGSIGWKVYVFPSATNIGDGTVASHQYFGLDLIKVKSKRSYWTHKPSVWQSVFELVAELAKDEKIAPISKVFNGIIACPVRATDGKNEIDTFQTASHQTIQHWFMLVPMPADIDDNEYITNFIKQFHKICQRPDIRSAYHEGVSGISTHSGMLNQVDDQGYYWTVVESAAEREIITKHCACLSEVLMDFTIREIVRNMFGINKAPDTWPTGIETFAYGGK